MRIPYLSYWRDTGFEIMRITGPLSWYKGFSPLEECRICGLKTELTLDHSSEMKGKELYLKKIGYFIDSIIHTINRFLPYRPVKNFKNFVRVTSRSGKWYDIRREFVRFRFGIALRETFDILC